MSTTLEKENISSGKVHENSGQEPAENGNGTINGDVELNQDSLEKLQSNDSEEDNDLILYEASLEYTELERSNATTTKLTCITGIIIILASVLFVFSFPFSLFLFLFCFETKRACLPCESIRHSPWKLYLTRHALHYHLPNPPQRPYINILYCLQRVYKYTIPYEDIKSISVENFSISPANPSGNINTYKMENVIIELEPGSPGIRAPVKSIFGLCSRLQTVHTVVIYSVKDASAFMEAVREHM